MRKNIKYFIIILIIIFLGTTLTSCSNSLRHSEKQIKEDLLTLTPIGTNMEEVTQVIEDSDRWELDFTSYKNGYIISEDGDIDILYDECKMPKHYDMVGNKSIRAYAGPYNYMFIIEAYNVVYYAFDKESELIDIMVIIEIY